MGSISTVSEQTFKTYCFMEEERVEIEMVKENTGSRGYEAVD